MATIKIFNKGKRIIHSKTFILHPEKGVECPLEEGNYTRRLFPDEVISIEDVTKAFDSSAAEAEAEKEAKAVLTPPAGLNKTQLKKWEKDQADLAAAAAAEAEAEKEE